MDESGEDQPIALVIGRSPVHWPNDRESIVDDTVQDQSM